MQIIPFEPQISTYSFSTPIDANDGRGEQTYHFDVHFNERESKWYFDLREADQTLIVPDLAIVLGAYIGRRCRHPLFLAGAFFAIDTSRDRADPTFEDLGQRVLVYYATEEEIVKNYLSANFIKPTVD